MTVRTARSTSAVSTSAVSTKAESTKAASGGRHSQGGRVSRSLLMTVPILLVGSMAVALGATPANAAPPKRHTLRNTTTDLGRTLLAAVSATTARASIPVLAKTAFSSTSIAASAGSTTAVPRTYRVASGDTVSSIASRYGLSTASVLALNGLGWKTMIFPGQELRLSKAKASTGSTVSSSTHSSSQRRYTIVSGDTVSSIAARYGTSTARVLAANNLRASSLIYPGQKLTIPTAGTTTIASTPAVSTSPIVSSPTKKKSYVIATGDTISSISSRFGVPASAILSANKLGASSIIYAGRVLVIPPASAITTLSPEMRKNARTIVRVGQDVGVSDYGIVVALAAAMQESGLRNLDYGHLDSVGLFQQRPSAGWGTVGQLRNPERSARLFYGGKTSPNAGKTPGLLDIPGWKSMSVTRAAQAVQVSAHPGAYAQWEKSARAWLRDLR